MSAMDVDPRDEPGAPSTSFPPDLFELASDVAMVGAPPSDVVASQIFQMHPLPDVFAAIGEADEGSKREADLCSFLDRMFQTGPGKAMLASAMPYARAGMQADSPRVRQLACTQLGRAAQQVVAAAPEDSAGCLTSLVDAVGDEDSGVAAAAADALLAITAASASIGGQILTRVSESARNERRAEPRLRGHALAAAISAGAGAGDAAALTRALLLELDATNSDPLASIATMELVAEIVEKTPRSAVALALCDATLPRLAAVAAAEPGENENENDVAAGFARARAATVGARIASAASTARGSFNHASGGDALLDALASLLARAVQGEEGDGELGEAACAAVTSLAESATAVAALCAGAKHDRVAILSRVVHLGLGGRRVPTGTRVAALHAVATFAGAGDQTGRKSRLAAPAAPHEPACGSAAAAETAEAAMRDAAYDAAEARGVTVGECVSESLVKGGDSFLELRIAAYRCVASLGRRPWFAAEVATSPKALALVTDPAYESTPPGCRWRHEAASGMLAAARAPRGVDASVSDGAAARLEAAVAGGPFGNGVGGQGAPRVAVAQR